MAYNPLNPNGQATMANSQPVVISSNQSPVSVAGTVTANQGGVWVASISGTAGASIIGTVPVTQSTSPWIITGSVQASLTPAANQSVSGTVGASVIGTVPVTQSGSWTQSVVGTVTANQGTTPWIITGSVQGSFTPAANQSVSGTVTALQGTNPWIITGSVQGSFAPSGNQSVSGTVGASIIGTAPVTQAGAWTSSVVGTVFIGGSVATIGTSVPNQSVSGTVGASIIGLTPVTVVGLQGASVSGTVNVIESGTWITSIAGGYATGAPSVLSGLGILEMGVRNDTMASVLSNDGQYSPFAVGPVGERITSNAPITKWLSGNASILAVGPQVSVLGAQGAGIFTYVTAVQIANPSANPTLITFGNQTSATSFSVLGYTIAPANGGSNIYYPNALKTGANSAFTASISGVASIFVTAEGFTSKT